MAYMDSDFKNSRRSKTDWFCNWVNASCTEAIIPGWIMKGKTSLILNDPKKGTNLGNYRLITCLLMMRKILTTQIREERKRYCKWTRGINNQLYINHQHILKRSQNAAGKRNDSMDWLRKSHGMVMQTWITERLKVYKISEKSQTSWRNEWKNRGRLNWSWEVKP